MVNNKTAYELIDLSQTIKYLPYFQYEEELRIYQILYQKIL